MVIMFGFLLHCYLEQVFGQSSFGVSIGGLKMADSSSVGIISFVKFFVKICIFLFLNIYNKGNLVIFSYFDIYSFSFLHIFSPPSKQERGLYFLPSFLPSLFSFLSLSFLSHFPLIQADPHNKILQVVLGI